jgi:hypothetical protein
MGFKYLHFLLAIVVALLAMTLGCSETRTGGLLASSLSSESSVSGPTASLPLPTVTPLPQGSPIPLPVATPNPSPIPISTPKPTPIPTITPKPMTLTPYGVPAPAGYQWVVTYDEEFTSESDVNHNTWNNAQDYTMTGANGIAIQGVASESGSGYLTNTNNSVTQTFGYWEWYAKFPHNDSGEANGYHSDLYLGSNANDAYIEDDVCEWDTDFTGATWCQNAVNEALRTVNYLNPLFYSKVPNGGSGTPPIGDAFHVWGMWWRNNGSAQGSVQDYFDGAAQTAQYNLQNSEWSDGMRPLIINHSCADCSTANNNPLYIRYFRIWKLQQN